MLKKYSHQLLPSSYSSKILSRMSSLATQASQLATLRVKVMSSVGLLITEIWNECIPYLNQNQPSTYGVKGGRSTFGHSGNDRTRDEPAREEPPAKKSKTTKREQIEEEVESIVTKLKNKHPEMATPKIRLWAKLIQTGRYEDMDTPPRYTTYYRCTSSCKAKKRRCC